MGERYPYVIHEDSPPHIHLWSRSNCNHSRHRRHRRRLGDGERAVVGVIVGTLA